MEITLETLDIFNIENKSKNTIESWEKSKINFNKK